MEEQQSILALKKGDHTAFVHIYNGYWDQVYDFARLYVDSVIAAEEVVQDVFVKLWESRGLLKDDENMKGFLFIVTRNVIFNRTRKIVNENRLKVSVLSAFGNGLYATSSSAEEELCASQLKDFINQLIDSLPEQQRKCFLLSREENLCYREIAERLGISQKTVEAHMNKALNFLKEKLRVGWDVLFMLLYCY